MWHTFKNSRARKSLTVFTDWKWQPKLTFYRQNINTEECGTCFRNMHIPGSSQSPLLKYCPPCFSAGKERKPVPDSRTVPCVQYNFRLRYLNATWVECRKFQRSTNNNKKVWRFQLVCSSIFVSNHVCLMNLKWHNSLRDFWVVRERY